MSNSSRLPPAPRDSLYGWPLADRREEFRRLAAQPDLDTHRVADFQGRTITLPILRVPINLPKYRISNGRTASAQQEWVASRRLAADFFEQGDPELEAVQEAQHNILRSMVKEEGLQERFKNLDRGVVQQVDPLLLDENGFVVNGNRRLCCWRDLHTSDANAFSHFSHVDIVVLPPCDEKALDKIEAKLQIERDIRSEYSWDSEANMIAQKMRLHGFSSAEISKLYDMTKKEIDDLLTMRDLADEYLKSRGRANVWSEVSKHKYAFIELNKAISSAGSAGDKEIIKYASFSLIDDSGETGERLYSVIPKVKDHLQVVKEKLSEAFPVSTGIDDPTALQAFGGPNALASSGSSGLALVAAIRADASSIKKAREVIIEAIRAQDEQNRERQTADFLLKNLKKANGLIQAASGHGLRPESTINGVSAQVKAIREALNRIEEWLKQQKE